jgi:hypothetical protein
LVVPLTIVPLLSSRMMTGRLFMKSRGRQGLNAWLTVLQSSSIVWGRGIVRLSSVFNPREWCSRFVLMIAILLDTVIGAEYMPRSDVDSYQ